MIEINRPDLVSMIVCDFPKKECCFCFNDLEARKLGLFSVPIASCKSKLEKVSRKEIAINSRNLEDKKILKS